MDFDGQVLTRVTSSRIFDKQLAKMPGYIQGKVFSWIFWVQTEGIWTTMMLPGHHDEPLKGSRLGQRSIRLNRSYRLIYRVISDRVHIELLEVHKHDY